MAKKTRAKRRGGASRGSDSGSGTVTDPQAPGGSRCAVGPDTTGRQETTWPGGSNLLRHPKGSNGGVHRGPDRQLRINAVRSILMEALAKEGARLVIDDKSGRQRRHRSKIPMALVENLITRLQEIAFSGSDGDVLRLVFGMHEIFQPGKHEKTGDTPRPRPATFVVAPPTSTEESSQHPAHPVASGTLVDANGQEYVG